MKMSPSKNSLFAHPLVRRYGATALLGTSLVGVAGVIGYETDWGQSWNASVEMPTKVAKASAEPALLPNFAAPPIDPTYKETVERPLFLPTRRPAPPGTTAPIESMRKGQYKLTGTSINATMTAAFFIETTTGKALRAVQGAEIGQGSGIKLDSVGATRVVLRQGNETEELTLRTAASPPRPAVATVMPPGQNLPGNVQSSAAGFSPPGGPVNSRGQFVNNAIPSPTDASAGTATSGGLKPPTEANSLAPPTAQAAQPVDPNAAVLRRRRFQNLPQ